MMRVLKHLWVKLFFGRINAVKEESAKVHENGLLLNVNHFAHSCLVGVSSLGQ